MVGIQQILAELMHRWAVPYQIRQSQTIQQCRDFHIIYIHLLFSRTNHPPPSTWYKAGCHTRVTESLSQALRDGGCWPSVNNKAAIWEKAEWPSPLYTPHPEMLLTTVKGLRWEAISGGPASPEQHTSKTTWQAPRRREVADCSCHLGWLIN